VSDVFERRLSRLQAADSPGCLAGGRKGIEKESLRVGPDGLLSPRPHPLALGSALTNKFITTDFSEALLEFVTPAYHQTWGALRTLCDIHQFTYERLDDEYLWVTSMPCAIPTDREIPLAQYGSSNVAQMKTVYRNGLGYRYGRNMQTIAGIHFNYSLPDGFWELYRQLEEVTGSDEAFRSAAYFGLLRNFRRFGWLVLYLFGASPALCKTFAGEQQSDMPSLDSDTYYQPYATSLRMSDLGYSNNTQANINISLNDVEEYIDDLSRAIVTPEPEFEKIGRVVGGEYRQLSVNQLQIENEYYNSIRPKRVAISGERPTSALRRDGVEYVEIRSLDLNVFDPVGISQNTMRFVEALLVYCLLEDSPPFDDSAYAEVSANHALAAESGRKPGLELQREGEAIGLREWADEIIGKVYEVALLIDQGSDGSDYTEAVDAQRALIENPDLTPSARVLQDLNETGSSFFAYAFEIAKSHKSYFANLAPVESDRQAYLGDEAKASIQAQKEIEESENISFDEYLQHYFDS
jgi:glutamate--cysteine ligase